MRKKDKLIFYLGGIVAPYFFINIWFISGIILLYIPFLNSINPIIMFIVFPILGFKYIRKLHRYQLRKYTRDLEQPSKDKIYSLAQNWWNLHVIIFPGLLILITITIPMFLNVKTIPSSSVKDGLIKGVRECAIRNYEKQTIRFSDVQYFQLNYTRFKIQSLDPNTCFKARAVPSTNQNTWFEIEMDKDTDAVTKTCGDSSKSGCKEGNTW